MILVFIDNCKVCVTNGVMRVFNSKRESAIEDYS